MKNLIENFSNNVEIQVMAKKIREIVEYIDEITEWIRKKEHRISDCDCLGCNTLPEEEDIESDETSYTGIAHDTIPEENPSCKNCGLPKRIVVSGGFRCAVFGIEFGGHDFREKKEEYHQNSEPKHTLPEERCCELCECATYTDGIKSKSSCNVIGCSCHQSSEPKHNHINGTAGCGECQKRQKECEHLEGILNGDESEWVCSECGKIWTTGESVKYQKEKELIEKYCGIILDGRNNKYVALTDFLNEYKII